MRAIIIILLLIILGMTINNSRQISNLKNPMFFLKEDEENDTMDYDIPPEIDTMTSFPA